MSFKCFKCHLNNFKSNGFDLKSMKKIGISLHLIVLVCDYLREVNRYFFSFLLLFSVSSDMSTFSL